MNLTRDPDKERNPHINGNKDACIIRRNQKRTQIIKYADKGKRFLYLPNFFEEQRDRNRPFGFFQVTLDRKEKKPKLLCERLF